jgi:gliding motility-associated-like protein
MFSLTRTLVLLFLFTGCVLKSYAQLSGSFYWVGGTGNWSDTTKWSSENGGLPGPDDHVFFNENSFSQKDQVVTIDTEANCRDMNWSVMDLNPAMSGNKKLNIHGSLKLAKGMIINYNGPIHFLSNTANNQLLLDGNVLKSHLYFNGEGTWELLDTLDIGHRKIFLNKGTLIFSNRGVTCGSLISTTNEQRTLLMDGSYINIVSTEGVWNVNIQLILQAQPSSTIRFIGESTSTVNVFNGGGLHYNNVIFENHAALNGSNQFTNIFLNAARNYILPENNTQTITGQLFARGCAGLIGISSSGSEPAMISKANGSLQISFAALRSIHAQVSAPYQFTAHNSVDEGNNNGIVFTIQNRDLYWINGSGNWTDTTHWTSLPINEDSDCAPMDFDNVFFNEDSFFDFADSVKVNIPEIRVNNMTWIGEKEPVFLNTTDPATITIYGSLHLSQKMKNMFTGPIHFNDSLGGKSVITSNRGFLGDLVFNGNNGGWTVYDSLNTVGSIRFMQGSLNTNGNYLSCMTFLSDSAFLRTLFLDTSIVKINGSAAGISWSMNKEFLEFDPGTSRIEISAANGNLNSFGGDTILYHDVTFLNSIGKGQVSTLSETYGIFRKVEFMSNGSISGNNSFDTLSFSPGCYYDLPSGSTQTIHGDIYPSGICEGPILIKSSTNGLQASLHKTIDTLRVQNTALRDINALGGAVFIADESVDLGNNIGWDTIVVTAPGKLFWVGGTGDWSDVNHWATTSGGVGGVCVPTPFDTVIFDQNSFNAVNQSVNVNLNNAFAGYMDWSAAEFVPEFKGNISSSWLRNYGSVKLNPNMIFTFPGYLSFESTHMGETLLLEGIKFHNINNKVFFDGIGGEWTLLDSLQLSHNTSYRNSIYFYNGILITNNQFVECYGFYASRPTVRQFHPGASHFDVYQEWNIHGESLTMTDNTSLIRIAHGNLIHKHGGYAPYHDVMFYSGENNQYMLTQNVDDLRFRNVHFDSPSGSMYGTNCVVKGNNAVFNGEGFVNNSNGNNVNVYHLDSLIFHTTGHIFGKDTINHLVVFNGAGNITGNGHYAHALFLNDGVILGNNIFDTLTFNPPYTYQLGSQDVQTITNQFNITGNNCEFIYLQATTDILAEVFKESGFVQGNFIEMANISATGEADFDAGQFSIDVDNSNVGWIFHDPALNYKLVGDSSFQQGDTVYLCADNFNGNSSTTYEWKNCDTGETLGSDSCLTITQKGTYCLTVFYNEGEGCEKSDTIDIGCHLLLAIEENQITCHGFEDGSIQVFIEVGEEPFNVQWQINGVFLSDSLFIENLQPGTYVYQITDFEGCYSAGNIVIDQPEEMELSYSSLDACYEVENGAISLEVTGGTEPYLFEWFHGDTIPDLIGLSSGSYEVIVTDSNKCPDVVQTVIINEIPELKFDLLGSDLLCFNDHTGEIQITELEGGTGVYSSFYWSMDNSFYSENQNISGLLQGNYELMVTDDRGCTGKDSIIIFQPDSIQLELESLKEAIELGSIDLTVAGGTPPYTYLWNTGATTEDIDPLGGGWYTVSVKDGNDCEATGSIFVEVHYRIYAPTAFSPNGDGVNDTFRLFGLGTDLKDFNLTIFNRFGQLLFESNSVDEGWNGRLMNTGQLVPTEVYTWQAKITYIGGASLIETGNVTLLR